MPKLSYEKAINEALYQAMVRDETIFVYGIGVSDHKAVFGTTAGLAEAFPGRCFDTPLSEDAMTGFGFGAAINGLRPVHIHLRVDFAILGLNQLVNMISSYNYLTNGRGCPIVIRLIVGRGWGQGCQHSKSLHSWFAHIPGLKVIAPTTAYDAKGLLLTALTDNRDPVVMLEHRWLYWAEDEVPADFYAVSLNRPAVVRRVGRDVTVAAVSWMVPEALQAAEILARIHYLDVEVMDVTVLNPFDPSTIVESVSKTHRLLVADNDWLPCGMAAEILTAVSERLAPGTLAAKPVRVGWAFTQVPTARLLEDAFYCNAATIVRAVERMYDLQPCDLSKEDFYSHERKFRGPF